MRTGMCRHRSSVLLPRLRSLSRAPEALRWHLCRRVVEVLVVGLEKPHIDRIQVVAEDLLRRLVPVGHGVGAEKHAVLIAIEEATGCTWLPAELADPGANLCTQNAPTTAASRARHAAQFFLLYGEFVF